MLLSSIYFIEAYNGWISGNTFGGWGSALFSTNDGGINWITQFMSNNTYINELEFLDDSFGYFIGIEAEGRIPPMKSAVYKTTNGGATWVSQATSAHKHLLDISFTDANNGWVVGEGGTILHTTNGGISFVDDATTQPTEFILDQNYPNPFNPNTKISWQSPVASQQTIKIYDVLGSEIATLVDEYKPAGKYEAEFDGGRLASGIYFYQLRAVDPSTGSGQSFVQTRKMILLK